MTNRIRIGIISAADGIIDDELWAMIPDNVTLLVSRIPLPSGEVTVELVKQLAASNLVEEEAKVVGFPQPRSIAFDCTSVSFALGTGSDLRMVEGISKRDTL